MDNETGKMLINKAVSALQQAHAPYSGYKVGAALLTKGGDVFTGCNMENASYGLTMCAERNAFASAIQSGARDFTAIAIVADSNDAPYPCGACRQVMAEFCNDDFAVLTAKTDDTENQEEFQLGELLPKRFNKSAG